MALKTIKNKITATHRTGKVTKAMEAVSAVKMRKSQELALKGREYAYSALRILENLSSSKEGLKHPLAVKHIGSKRSLLVTITSDKGLAGNLNSAVLKEAELFVNRETEPDIDFICIGKKSRDFALRQNCDVLNEYLNMSDDVSIDVAGEIARIVTERFKNGEYDRVRIIYQNFISTFEQKATVRTILPLNQKAIHEIVEGIAPKTGRFSEENYEPRAVSYEIEPSDESVLDTLIPQLVEIMIYHALVETKASEHSARMVAMKNATDKAKEVTRELTIQYNKERQAVITREVSEITGGIEAMAHS